MRAFRDELGLDCTAAAEAIKFSTSVERTDVAATFPTAEEEAAPAGTSSGGKLCEVARAKSAAASRALIAASITLDL